MAPAGVLLGAACHGPALHIDNPDQHQVFVDGRRVYKSELPFRYYGTTRWDALPADVDGGPDWTHRPGSEQVTITPAISPLLFPLDLPIDLLWWIAGGHDDVTTTITLPTTDAQQRAESELGNLQLAELVERALAARASR